MAASSSPLYQPNPAHVRTGTFALALTGHNWDHTKRETAYGRSWVTLPILQSSARAAKQQRVVRLRPAHWPIIFDYAISDACERIQSALQPPQRVSSTVQRNALGVKQTDVIRACELAGFIQAETGLDSFVVLFHVDSRRVTDFAGDYLSTEIAGLSLEGLIPVAVPMGQHAVSEHVLNLGEKLFYDMPRERGFLWDELAEGKHLTASDREQLPWKKIVPPPLMNTGYTPYDPTAAVVQPPPAAVGDYVKAMPPEPKVDSALERLKQAMGL